MGIGDGEEKGVVGGATATALALGGKDLLIPSGSAADFLYPSSAKCFDCVNGYFAKGDDVAEIASDELDDDFDSGKASIVSSADESKRIVEDEEGMIDEELLTIVVSIAVSAVIPTGLVRVNSAI